MGMHGAISPDSIWVAFAVIGTSLTALVGGLVMPGRRRRR